MERWRVRFLGLGFLQQRTSIFMTNRGTEHIESFAYEGALDWSTATWVFFGLALLIGFLLWRERRITGRGTAAFFFVLRLAAVALVLWMLLGPTHLSTDRTTIPQTLAVVIDGSQSMEVAEPMQKVDRLRWKQATGSESPEHPELLEIDTALVALRHASTSLRMATTAAREFAPADEVAKFFEV